MHFSDLGNDPSIRKALSLLQKQNFIRRLAQGIYDYPIMHDLLGIIPPDLNEVAKAIAEKNGHQAYLPVGDIITELGSLSTRIDATVL